MKIKLILAAVVFLGMFASSCRTNQPEVSSRRVPFSIDNPAHGDIPEAVVRVYNNLTQLQIPEVDLRQIGRQDIINYFEYINEGFPKYILHPHFCTLPFGTERFVTLNLVRPSYLEFYCRISEISGFKVGVTGDGSTLIIINADDPAPPANVYFIERSNTNSTLDQYEVILPLKD